MYSEVFQCFVDPYYRVSSILVFCRYKEEKAGPFAIVVRENWDLPTTGLSS